MCSINGFNFRDEKLIGKMNQATKHRGPDDSGIFLTSNWSLGHNRLSIIDLSSDGHQPMLTRDNKHVIIYNGEIYNYLEIKKELESLGYKFRSKTDTEVVLYAYKKWGPECLQKFNGMFALAILDTETEEIFLARDRIGIKPLYYCHKDDKIIFSSEVKAILEHSLNCPISIEALNAYFRLLYIPSPLTIWQNIYKLPPAHYALIKNGGIKINRYWQIKNEPLIDDKKQIESEISNLLHSSVQKRLMSDRPVGVFLSGGIDSTIITGIMSSLSDKVNTFSVGFEKTKQAEVYNNDFLLANKTAKYFKTNHHEHILSASDVKQNLEKTIYHMDELISNHIQTVNLLLSKYATQYVKVVLGGDGGDELFGGYERYYYNMLIDKWQSWPRWLRQNVMMDTLFRVAGKDGAYKKLNCPAGIQRYLEFFSQKENVIADVLKPEYNKPEFLPDWMQKKYFSKVDRHNFTRQFMQVDLATWMPDESLVRSDKMSMAFGLEQRVPFLDHRLVELADRIPIEFKIGSKGLKIATVNKGYIGKKILISAMEKYLPKHVLGQSKWGWFSPASKWLRGPLYEFAREVLSPSYCAGTQNILNFDDINKIFNNHINAKQYALNTIWSVMTFQLWYRQFMKK